VVPPATRPALSQRAIEDAASDLSRQSIGDEHAIDVARSVIGTAERGGLPTLVHRPRVVVTRYLVLQDVADGAERWRFLYDALRSAIVHFGSSPRSPSWARRRSRRRAGCASVMPWRSTSTSGCAL